MPAIDVLASNSDQSRRVTVQVKAKYGGRDWQTTILRGKPREPENDDETIRYWVLMDLRPDQPLYYVMPEWWIQNDIHQWHAAYLDRAGSARVRNHDSTHHAIKTDRVERWLDRWDLLGIFPAE